MSDSYVKHGFLADVYERWVSIEGSEWGDAMTALHAAYNNSSVWDDQDLDAMEAILRRHLQDGYDEGWLIEDYEVEFVAAQEDYAEIREAWRERSKAFVPDLQVFAKVEAEVPEWMKASNPEVAKQAKLGELERTKADLTRRMAEVDRKIEEVSA